MNKENICYNIEQLIKKHCGEHTAIEITNLQLIKDGFSNDIAMLDIKYNTKDGEVSKEVVFKDYSKTYKGNSGTTKYNKEVSILKSNHSSKYIDVPEIYFSDAENTIVLMEHRMINYTFWIGRRQK